MKKFLISSVTAALFIATLAAAQNYTFSANLTVGSTGTAVAALQTWLIQNGYHIASIESGAVAKGRFGSQTKAAVMKYQKAQSLPSTGFVGPLTRAKLNGNSVATNPGTANAAAATNSSGCMTGFICYPNGAMSPAGLPAGITTVGASGIMAVTQGPLSSSVIKAGQKMAPLITIRIQAQNSDLDFSGMVLDLGTDTNIYNKIFSTGYVMDGSKVLFTTPLNSTTVVSDQGQYVWGSAGYDVIIPKGTYKDITLAADLYPSIDSKYINESPWTVSIDKASVSSVDGSGVILYGPDTDGSIYESLTINTSSVDNAQANISLDSSAPKKSAFPVTDTTNHQYLGLPVFAFDVNAQNDSLHLHEVKVNFGTSGTGSITAAYLMQGSTRVSSASVSSGQADFTNITDGTAGASIPVNTSLPYTVSVDVTGVTSASAPFIVTASASSTLLTIYSSNDSTATVSGNATGNGITVSTVGPLFSLVGTPSIIKEDLTAVNATVTTKKYTATFNVQVQAVGTDVYIGLPASSTPGQSFGSSTTGINVAQIFVNSTASATPVTTIADYTKPSTVAVQGPDGANSFSVPRNSTVVIPVKYSFVIVNSDSTKLGDNYAVQLQGINWSSSNGANGPTTFMANDTTWRAMH